MESANTVTKLFRGESVPSRDIGASDDWPTKQVTLFSHDEDSPSISISDLARSISARDQIIEIASSDSTLSFYRRLAAQTSTPNGSTRDADLLYRCLCARLDVLQHANRHIVVALTSFAHIDKAALVAAANLAKRDSVRLLIWAPSTAIPNLKLLLESLDLTVTTVGFNPKGRSNEVAAPREQGHTSIPIEHADENRAKKPRGAHWDANLKKVGPVALGLVVSAIILTWIIELDQGDPKPAMNSGAPADKADSGRAIESKTTAYSEPGSNDAIIEVEQTKPITPEIENTDELSIAAEVRQAKSTSPREQTFVPPSKPDENPKEYYTIQLAAFGEPANRDRFLNRLPQTSQLRAITEIRNGRTLYAMMWGSFSTITEARDALQDVPPELIDSPPQIRLVEDNDS